MKDRVRVVPPRPPVGLGPSGRALWRDIVADLHDRGLQLRPDELRVLGEAARTADMVDRLDAQVASDGLMTDGSRGQRVLHPAIHEASVQRDLLSRLLARLQLAADDDDAPTKARASKAARARWTRRDAVQEQRRKRAATDS